MTNERADEVIKLFVEYGENAVLRSLSAINISGVRFGSQQEAIDMLKNVLRDKKTIKEVMSDKYSLM